MGLGSLFSGGSSKKNTTHNITTTTETTTNMRDVGLTGASAVNLASVLQMGANDSEAIRAQSLDNITQSVGDGYQQLVGGANNLVSSVKDISDNQTEATGGFLETIRSLAGSAERQTANNANLVQNSAQDAQNTIRQLSDRATNEDSDTAKIAPYVAVVGVALISLYMANQ